MSNRVQELPTCQEFIDIIINYNIAYINLLVLQEEQGPPGVQAQGSRYAPHSMGRRGLDRRL